MTQQDLNLPRRRLIAGTTLAGASLGLPGALRFAQAQAPLTVGVMYVEVRFAHCGGMWTESPNCCSAA